MTWFRYPYLGRGQTVKRRDQGFAALEKMGQRIAPVSVDNSEWALARPYVEALNAGDTATAAAIGAAYVDHLVTATRHFRAVARERVGRDIAHVLLLHASALAADHLGAALDAIRAEGLTFVDLETAMRDPVYARPDAFAGHAGVSWLYRLAPVSADRWKWDDAQLEGLRRRFGR